MTGILLSVAACAIWAAIAAGGRRLTGQLRRDNPRRRRDYVLAISAAYAAVLALSLGIEVAANLGLVWGVVLLSLGACLWGFSVIRELDRYWQVGFLGVDRQIRSGLSYDRSLRLITNQLSFLGTGAHKLTTSSDFERVMKRCPPNSPIRFLLRRPDDSALQIAARKADKPDNQYREQVVESLRILAKVQRGMNNLEVRFYDTDLIFRIMVIDRRYALVSFNVYGRSDDGSGLPQLIVRASAEGHDSADSFFHAFDTFFDERWKESKPWDFQQYL